MEFKASASTTSEYKTGDVYVKPRTPVVYTSTTELIETLVGRLHSYGLFKKMPDGKVSLSLGIYI